jgi:hypothetical protein
MSLEFYLGFASRDLKAFFSLQTSPRATLTLCRGYDIARELQVEPTCISLTLYSTLSFTRILSFRTGHVNY